MGVLKKIQSLAFIFIIAYSSTCFAAKIDKVPTLAKLENVYTEEKPNIVVTAAQPEFVIKLKSNPTTGYSWFLRDYDTGLISPKKHSFEKTDTGLIGAPGYELWTFAIKPNGFTVPQQTTLRFVYTRPWQGADSSSQVVFRVSTQGK